MNGWAGKILSIDLSDRKIEIIDTEKYNKSFIGGLGIAEKIYWDEASPDTGAFAPENPLIFMTGPLAATSVPAAPRFIASGRSPLMWPEHFYSASLAGFFGPELKLAGYDGIIIKGKSDSPVYITIKDEKIEIKDARHLWGHTNSQTQSMIRSELGGKARLLSIGPGAEHGSRIGTIYTDVAGSGSRGFGSVMGAKNLKAIAVTGTGKIAVVDTERVQLIRDKIKKMTGEGFFNLFGTPLSLPGTSVIKKVHCHGCPMGCWRTIHRSAEGKEDIRKCQTALFYTLWDKKLHQEITETSFIATTMANDYSFCILEIVFLLRWLEKCYEQGILSEQEIGLPMSTLGSLGFLEALFKKISRREGLGEILAEGVMRAAKRVGKDAEQIEYAGRPFPYGPKVFLQSALLYAIEPRPLVTELHEVCEPLTKWAIWHKTDGTQSYVSTDVLRKIAKRFWGSEEAVDFSTSAGKALSAIRIQNREYAKESLILCDFVWPIFDDASSEDHVGDQTLDSQVLSAVTGEEIDESALDRIGERIFNLNRLILLREGRKGREDDWLPETQFTESVEPIADVFGMHNPDLLLPGAGNAIISRKGKAVKKETFMLLRDEYYDLRGWDKITGIPKKEKLKEIGLDEIIG